MDFILPIFLYSAIFMALFAFAELLYLKAGTDAEYTRKIVHAGTGVLTLGFPVYFESPWQVIIICLLFLALLAISKKTNMLRSINAVKRKTAGSILYPVIVILVFLFYRYRNSQNEQGYLNFYLPILIMALCDPIAAIAGTLYQQKKRSPVGKTLAGTLSFIASAFIVSVALMVGLTNMKTLSLLGWSAIIASITGITERITGKGWDNFTIPLAAMAVLYLMNYYQ
jgi:phytol kinase